VKLQSRGLANFDKPPAKLGLTERQQKRSNENRANDTAQLQNAPVNGGFGGDVSMQFGFPMGFMMAKEMFSLLRSDSPPRHRKSRRRSPSLSDSSPAKASSDDQRDTHTINYPLLSDWLKALDEHPLRGQDKRGYIQWAEPLNNEDYVRLSDIHGLNAEALRAICPGMKQGTAKRILDFVKEDMTELERSQRDRKRARRN
jgi:hypothetical protein